MEEDIVKLNKATSELVQGINRLLIQYLDELGIPFRPVVMLKTKADIDMRIEPKDMVEILDEILGDKLVYPKGVKTKARRRRVVLYRQIGFKLLRDMGLSHEKIGKAFDISHATVIHGVKSLNNLLETNDHETIITYTDVLTKVKELYNKKYGTNVSLPNPTPIKPKSVLSIVGDKKRNKPTTNKYTPRNEAALNEFMGRG